MMVKFKKLFKYFILFICFSTGACFVSCAYKAKSKSCFQQEWSEEKIIEGYVSNYKPMRNDGHESLEFFMIDSLFFYYSDYIVTGFYNNSCIKGGLICRDGLKVRITYKTQCDVINGIVKIEILNSKQKN